MLTVKTLDKVYNPKKGEAVAALKDISLTFPDVGMVFLLGKSGSGKSTLLNILGGLDIASGGELFIKGRSMSGFNEGDYDSYRNTFVGFVFQEFNFLEEYSVGENIAIALELQHKKAAREDIEKVMAAVDLESNLLSRKIGELSGGQKQRVAIARALIKNPDIIMADEPTGSLDSVTGRQVFETLKKLSENKLVIAVSHDRESAEEFGERIIELADGKVISDRTRGADGFFVAASPDVSIAPAESGALALVKSSLPAKDSLRLGVSGLKIKRLRLFFTIFLSFIAFTVFGLSCTIAAIDPLKIEYHTAKLNGERTLLVTSLSGCDADVIGAVFFHDRGPGIDGRIASDIERITGNKPLRVYDGKIFLQTKFSFSDSLARRVPSPYYTSSLSNFLEVERESDAGLIPAAAGSRLPALGNHTEIAVSDWVADSFIVCGLDSGGERKTVRVYEDLLNEKILLKDELKTYEMTVTGVYRTDIKKENYDKFKNVTQVNSIDEKLLGSRMKMIFSMGFVCPGFELPIGDQDRVLFGGWSFKTQSGIGIDILFGEPIGSLDAEGIYLGGRELSSLTDDDVIVTPALWGGSSDPEEIMVFFDGLGSDTLTVSGSMNGVRAVQFNIAGVLLSPPINQAAMFFSAKLSNDIKTASNRYAALRPPDTAGKNYGVTVDNRGTAVNITEIWRASNYDLTDLDIYWGEDEGKSTLNDDEIIILASILSPSNEQWTRAQYMSAFDDMPKNALFGMCMTNWSENELPKQVVNGMPVKIAGIIFERNSASLFSDAAYAAAASSFNDSTSVVVRLSEDWGKNKELFDYLKNSLTEDRNILTKLKPYTSATGILEHAEWLTNTIKNIALYFSIGVSVFAGLLLMNFIGVSIANKKKDIGILRALGARRIDVFKIFLSEGLIIGTINFVLSLSAVIAVSTIVNKHLKIGFLSPGIAQAALIAALSLVISAAATFFPTYKIAKKKPIDAINNR